jgi:hypothetical protein
MDFLTCLQWFCYGYTAVTLSGVIFLIVLSYLAAGSNAKFQEGIRKMMAEDPE